MAENMRTRPNKHQQESQSQRQHHHRRQHQRQMIVATHEEEEETTFIETISLPYRKAYDMAEKFATTRIGQFIITRGDRLLKIIETTAKWSLPPDQIDDKVQRPLPWIPFLITIIALRLARIWVSIGAVFIGNAPVKAQDVVYFVQTRRRKLRALRLRGIKEICRREAEAMTQNSASGENSFVAKLKHFFSSAICRPGLHREAERRIMIHRGKEVICVESDSSPHHIAKRPRSDDCEEANMTLDELINKLANDNTEDDSDFIPNPAEEEEDNSGTSSETSESTDATEALAEEITPELEHSKESKNERSGKLKESSHDHSVELTPNTKGDSINMPKPIIDIKQEISSDTETDGNAKTPLQNGPRNGAENREVDVAFKFVLTPPGMENGSKKHLTPTMEIEKLYKPTSANASRSLAETQAFSSTAFEAATAAAHETDPIIDLTDTDTTSSDAVDSTFTETDNEDSFNISNTESSPTLTATSSSTSNDSFLIAIKNEDTIFSKNDARAMATSTPPTINSISSSEDDFYSLIGSPPDFNAFHKEQQERETNFSFNYKHDSIKQSNNNILQKTVSEPHIGNNDTEHSYYPINPSTSVGGQRQEQQKTVSEPHIGEHFTSNVGSAAAPPPPTGRRQHQHQNFHGNSQHRYRGRNRRN